jgi:hypothetical protein
VMSENERKNTLMLLLHVYFYLTPHSGYHIGYICIGVKNMHIS